MNKKPRPAVAVTGIGMVTPSISAERSSRLRMSALLIKNGVNQVIRRVVKSGNFKLINFCSRVTGLNMPTWLVAVMVYHNRPFLSKRRV